MSEAAKHTKDVKRPLLRYHGGKWRLGPWIISHFPEHRIYTETFGGAGSILLRKERSYAEVYNDLDDEIVNLFQVVRTRGSELNEALSCTPYSRSEFELSYMYTECAMERARRTVIRSFMGFCTAAVTSKRWAEKSTGFRVKGGYAGEYGRPATGFRSNTSRSYTHPALDWKNLPLSLDAIIERLKGVVIENRDAKIVMAQHDTPLTLHYVDPPYVKGTRYKGQKTSCYRYEMSDDEHMSLCQFLPLLKGFVVLSGYDNPIYNDMLSSWQRVEKASYADGAKKRQEVLWIKPNTL